MRAMSNEHEPDDESEDGSDDEPEVVKTAVQVFHRVHTGYKPFNMAAREEYLAIIRKGHKQSVAVRRLKLNPSVVSRWIKDGSKTEYDWLREGRTTEWFLENGLRYRRFWLSLQSAQAVADGLVHEVMVEAAIGTTTVKQVKNKKTGLVEEVVVRDPGDWKAADALSKYLERRDLHPGKLKLQRAEIAIREANIAAAQADARRAFALAELAERGIHPVNGLLVYPPEFLAQLAPEERQIVEGAMARLGYKPASAAAVQAMAEAQSEEDIIQKENFSERWRRMYPGPEDVS